MGINTPPSNPKSLADLYNDFFDDYFKDFVGDKKVYENIGKRYGKGNLMEIFIEGYYKGLTCYTVGQNVKGLKGRDYIENWKEVVSLYNAFRDWLNKHPEKSNEIKEFVYNDVRNKILSDDTEGGCYVYRYAYNSWEEYLGDSRREKAFDAWKELNCAYFEKGLKRLWRTLPIIMEQTKSGIDDNYYGQYLKAHEGCDTRKAFSYAVNRVLDEANITRKERGRERGVIKVIGNMDRARKKVLAIVGAYSIWRKLFDAQEKEALAEALASDEEERIGTKKVFLPDGTAKWTMGGDYVDEDGDVKRYFGDEDN